MAGLVEMWLFVMRKLKVPIPPYIKNVLKFSGYDSCHSIATIEENDFEYLETEVRKGNIADFFERENNADGKAENVLEGSTKTAENFEFSRGHKILLLSVVKLVKERMEEYGADGFSVVSPKKTIKKRAAVTADVTDKTDLRKRRKNRKASAPELFEETEEGTEEMTDRADLLIDRHIKHHKTVLTMKALSGLKDHNPEMTEEKLKFIKTKNLVQLARKSQKEPSENPLYTAKIKCPYCYFGVTVFHKLSTSEYGSWNTYSFERHLLNVHKSSKANEQPFEKCKELGTEKSLNEDAKEDVAVAHSIPSPLLSQGESESNKEEPKDYILIVVPPVVPPRMPPDTLTASNEVIINVEDIKDKTINGSLLV